MTPEAIRQTYLEVRKLLGDNGVVEHAHAGKIIDRNERTMRAYGEITTSSHFRPIPADALQKLMGHAIDLELGGVAEILRGYDIPGERALWTGGRRDDQWDLRERWWLAEPEALKRHSRKDLVDMTGLDPYLQIRCGIHFPKFRVNPSPAEVADLEAAAGIDPEKSAAKKHIRMAE
jgi:hypothetical protein